VLQRVASHVEFKKPLKEDLTYMQIRPNKVDKPDPGTYKVLEGVTFVKTKNPKYSVGKGKQIKFTEEMQKIKSYVPGVGQYKTEPCYDVIARPYVRKWG